LFDALLDGLAGLPTPLTYAVLMILSSLENVFPPVPADVAVALGAFLSRRGEVQAPLLGVLCWLANAASATGTYALARSRGRALVASGLGRKLLPPEALAALEEAYARHGVLGIFLSRFLPGLRAAVTPFAGLAGMAPLPALAPAYLASAVWYSFLVVAGVALGESWTAVKAFVEDANRALGVVALLATAGLALHFWRRLRARRPRP
jgi:membrane protein DedA with SNARE-associated domain